MPEPDWLFVDKHPPTAVGWYATTLCWDAAEGIFPDASYWDGQAWSRERPPVTARSPQTFATKALAEAWARAHDPEGLV